MTTPKPIISQTAAPAHQAVNITDEGGQTQAVPITAEYPLTVYLDKTELVTLMTLGSMPALLTLGWLRNQSIVDNMAAVAAVQVDWETNSVAVTLAAEQAGERVASVPQLVTSGCGQNTMLDNLMGHIEQINFRRGALLSRLALLELVSYIRELDTVYKVSGAVHGCLLAQYNEAGITPLIFIEDIGRHNAVDTIAGWMWYNEVDGANKVFYTTGRLTAEMVVKCAQMQIPYLVSRSMTTSMGYSVATQLQMTMIGRAINQRFKIITGAQHFRF